MKIHTLSQLVDYLATELSWRRKELTELKSNIDRIAKTKSDQIVYLRAGIALLYAHFEGYIKKASVAYLEFVRMQRLHYKDLSDHFLSIALKQKFANIFASKAYSEFITVTNFIRSESSASIDFNHKGVIDTESNLSSVIFKEIVLCLGLDYSVYAGIEKLIDVKLLQKRNCIAHGEYTDIDATDYEILHERIVTLLDNFKTQIENSAVLLNYCRKEKIPAN